MNEMTLEDINALFKNLKESRVILTWQEFADKLNYSRAYVSQVINEREPLTDEFRERVRRAFVDTTPGVIPQPEESSSIKIGGIQITLEDYVNGLLNDKLFLQSVVQTALVDISTNLSKLLVGNDANSETPQPVEQKTSETEHPRIFGMRPYPSKSGVPGQPGGKGSSGDKDKS